MKTSCAVFFRVLALTLILFICFSLAGRVLGRTAGSLPPEQVGDAAVALLAVCFSITIVMTHLILRSRWTGWRLIATVFLVFYGVMTFMPQIESAVFLTRLPPGMLPRLFLMGALIAAPFAALAVVILGKRKAIVEDAERNVRLLIPATEWAWKLAVIVIAYVVLYFSFGYFVAWKSPAVREYYGGSDPGSFLAQMKTVLTRTPWLIPFQMLRAILWVAIALPVIRMLKGPWQESALALGLLFAVTNAQLLIPNPFMPEAVRMTHLIETASSNFIFGCLIGGLLTPHHEFANAPIT